MKDQLRRWRSIAAVLALAFAFSALLPQSAFAGTTGIITGTVRDGKTGAPIANVKVSAASASQSETTSTDAHGFYSLVNLTPDTYTVSFQKSGYQAVSTPGVVVLQDQTATANEQMQSELRVIASVHASGSSNLVKSNQGSDVYTVGGEQLKAVTNPVSAHETLYQYLAVTPGVTGTGFPSQPRVRGGQVTDLGYEFEGIPIQDRITGFFTTNLSNVGISNIEVYTGGLPASGSTNGTGYFNSVLKTGTYPGFSSLSVQLSPTAQNQSLFIERGGGTANHKFTYYVAYDGTKAQNQYGYGTNTYPDVLFGGFNGPGPVRTSDFVSNFIFHPSNKDAVQFVYTNSLGEFDYNYLLNKDAGQPPALAFNPCSNNVADPNSPSGFSGGTAPNGASCPTGLYWGALPNGGGNIWHHYGALGKLQWNHNINDHSFVNLSFAENFNQYIFDQPLADPNIPAWENAGGGWNQAEQYGLPASTCPAYPYANGTPVQGFTVTNPDGTTSSHFCAVNDGPEVFWGDRNSHMYIGKVDYTNAISSKTTIKAGVSHEIDQNVYNYFLTNSFNGNGTWPNNYLRSIYPTTQDLGYAQGDFHVGKFLLSPGVAYAQMHYAYPDGGKTQRIINPTFNGTYTFDPNNVVRFSYGNTSSFVGTGYVYREGSSTYNPNKAGFAFSPQLNHSADLMFEHNFGNNTSLRFGPWFNKTTNYYESYRPVVSLNPYKLGPSVLSNAGAHQAFGLEFGLNHIDVRPAGVSYWISGTYDNYWTTSTTLAGSFVNSPIPQNLIDQGVMVRATGNPLFSGTFAADFHNGRVHVDPLVYYQLGSFYNVGAISTNGGTVPPYISQPESIAGGYWKVSLTPYLELGANRNILVGFKVDNLFNNTNDVTPCLSSGTGCYPFDGPQSGVFNQSGYIWQNYSQNPETIYVFAGIKM